MADAARVLARRLDLTFEAIAKAFRLAAEQNSAVALEFLADYMNDCDAVDDDDVAHYEKWVQRGKP